MSNENKKANTVMILQLKHIIHLHASKRSQNKSTPFSFLFFHKLNKYRTLTFNTTLLFWKIKDYDTIKHESF